MNDLNAAQGVINAVLLSLPIWGAIIAAICWSR